MKHLSRYLSVLLVVVCLFAVFSLPVSAASGDSSVNYNLTTYFITNGTSYSATYQTGYSGPCPTSGYDFGPRNFYGYDDRFEVNLLMWNKNGSVLMKSGKEYNIRLSNVYFAASYYNNVVQPFKKLDDGYIFFEVTYTDGTSNSFDSGQESGLKYVSDGERGTFSYSFTPSKDVKYISFGGYYTPRTRLGFTEGQYNVYFYNMPQDDQDMTHYLDIELVSGGDDGGFLSGIIDWIKSVFNKLGDIFTSLGNGFTNVVSNLQGGFRNLGTSIGNVFNSIKEGFTNTVNNIIELPSKLWEIFSNGLKSLFVPGDSFISGYRDKWDTLMGQRFGGLYEVVELIPDYINNIINANSNSQPEIELPSVSLSSVGIPFTFGGYVVEVVPSNFRSICVICKGFTSVLCTYLFINSLRKRYDEIMGG